MDDQPVDNASAYERPTTEQVARDRRRERSAETINGDAVHSTADPSTPRTDSDVEYETSSTVLEYVSALISRLSMNDSKSGERKLSENETWKQEYLRAYQDGMRATEPATADHAPRSAEAPGRPQPRLTFAPKAKGKRAQQIAVMRETANMMTGQALQTSDCVLLIRAGYRRIRAALAALVCAHIAWNLPFLPKSIGAAIYLLVTLLAAWWTACLVRYVAQLSSALPKASTTLPVRT